MLPPQASALKPLRRCWSAATTLCWAAATRARRRRRAPASSALLRPGLRLLCRLTHDVPSLTCCCCHTRYSVHVHFVVASHSAAFHALRRELVPTARGVELAIFDLADLASVRAWAQRAQDFGLPLDVLVNNAGKGWLKVDCRLIAGAGC